MSKVYLRKQTEMVEEVTLEEAFPFLNEKNHIISLVGAGGKTTLMYLLGNYFCQKGYNTLITTTTHIQRPKSEYWIHSLKELKKQWKIGKLAVVGESCGEGKITGPDQSMLNAYIQSGDAVLIEADGAKRMACKVPNDTEPVLIPQSDIVIGVMGLDVVGKPLKDVCFRLEQAKELLQVSDNHILTQEDMVRILTNPNGTRKNVESRDYYIVLNKCDNSQRVRLGEQIINQLYEIGFTHSVLTKLI